MKIISLLLTIALSGQVMAIETLKYDIIRKNQNIEIRSYEEYITASVTFDNKKDFDKLAFKTLANYIFGNNISMTSPVLTQGEKIPMTSPVLSGQENSNWSMSFSMPSKYTLQTLPKPNNPKVKLRKVAQSQMAAIRFSGFMSDNNYNTHGTKLKNWLDNNGYKHSNQFIRAGYNPPWTLPFLRRNEVLIQLK